MSKSYSSKSRTYFHNRFITGPDRSYFILAIILMFIPEIPFLIFICPLFQEWITPAIYVISIYLWIASYIFMFEAAYTDPGIVPRGVYDDDAFSHRTPLFKKITVKDSMMEIKWCDTCCIYRPPRANHCGICNNCVEHFDHHCPYIGNCIGRRNYQAFLYYLYTLGFKCLFIMGFCIAHIVIEASRYRSSHPDSSSAKVFAEAMNKSHYLSIIFIVYSLAGFLFVGSLGGFHIFLVFTNQSTNEKIKKTFKKGNPFRKSYWNNLIEACCPPRYPSYIKYSIDNEKELSDLLPQTSITNDGTNNNNNNNINNNSNGQNLYTPPISPPSIRYSLDNLKSSRSSSNNKLTSSRNDDDNSLTATNNNNNNNNNNSIKQPKVDDNANDSGNHHHQNNVNNKEKDNDNDDTNSNSSGVEAYDEEDDHSTNDEGEDFKSDKEDIHGGSVSMNHELQVHS